MTIFNNLFGTKDKKQDAAAMPVNRELFIDEEKPQETNREYQPRPVSLDELLTFDFGTLGYSEGYSEHNIGIMHAKLETVIADFRQAYCDEIDRLDRRMREIEPHLCDAVKEAMPSEYLNLNARYSELTAQKSEMQAQYEMAALGEGKCEPAIAKYKLGYQKGYALWTDENLLKNH